MADLDAFVTIASNNGDTFNISSNNDMLIYTDSLQQNILLGTDKTYFPHILLSPSTVEVFKNMNIAGDLNVTGILTQGGSTLGSKWSSLWRTIYLMDSNVSIGTTKSNSLLNIHDSNTTTPSNARITFSTDFTTEDGYASVGLSNTGDLLVWHTSNNNIHLGTSNDLRMIITSNGAVGISNASPAYTLDVGGDINITGDLYQNGQLFSSGQWSNDNSTIFVEQSNVAIGRTDANTLLHIHNPVADNALITFTNSVTQSNAGVLCGVDSNGEGILMHQNNFDIRMGTANSEYMRITSTGKVGVNTSFPQYQLDVYGATGAIEANVSSNLNTSNMYVEGILSSSNVANFTSNVYLKGLSFMEGDVEMSNNLMVINAFTSCNSISAEGTLDVKGTAGFSNTTTFYQPTTMYSNVNFVNAGSTYIASKAGNIGIKTENPANTLDVNGSITALGYCNLLVDSYSDTSTNKAPTANALSQLYNLLGTGAGDGIYASNEVVPTSNHAFNTWTGYTSTSVYTLKSNVGIGTATPATNLEIKDTTNTNVSIQLTNSTNSGRIGMSNDLFVINHNNLKSITFGNSGTEYMRLTENGYLGINTTAAAYHLDVAGDINFTGDLYKNGTAFQTSRWVSNADGIYIQSNVGIRTNPSTLYELDVGGDINFTGSLYKNGTEFQTSRWLSNTVGVYIQSNIGIQTNPNSTYELDVGGDINFTGTLFQNGAAFQTSRWTSNADGIYVTSNVGINTITTPTYDLDVGGDINFTGTLYQNGAPFQTSRWTSNASGVYVMSNVGINANATLTEALNIGGATVVAGNITPTTDQMYDLGSATNRFRDLWLSSNSLHLGDAVISATTSNGVDYINLPGGLKISSNIEIANSVAIRGLRILKRDGTMANITTTSIKGLSNDAAGIVLMMSGNAGTDSIRFVGNGNELMRLTGTGNLGIGTTTPAYKLDIIGDINFTGDIYKNSVLYSSGSSAGYSNMMYTSSNIITTHITYSTSNDSFKWLSGSSSNELMKLTGNGHLTLPGATKEYILTDFGVSNLQMPAYTTGTIIVDSNSPFDPKLGDGSFGFNGTASNNMCFSNSIYSFNWWQNGGFTIEAWVNYSTFTSATLGGNYPALVGCMQAFNNPDYWSFGANDLGKLTFQYFTNTGNWVYATTTLSTNTWYHIALTYDMTNIRIFQNGTLVSTPTPLTGTPSIAPPFTIGNAGNAYPTVKISSLRYVKGAALYTTNFTPSTTPLSTAPSGTTMLLLRAPQEPSRMLPTKIGGTTIENAYPPATLTANTTTLSNASYGIGSYTASASSAANPAFNAFDNNTGTQWSTSVAYSTTTPFGSTSTTITADVNGNVYTGEYIQIQLPVSITLSSYSMGGATNNAQSPGQWHVLGSTNSTDWYLVNHQANVAWASSAAQTFNVVRGSPYNYFRFVIARTAGNGSGVCSINEIKLYGQQESIYINQDGLVGIRNKNPSQALDVIGAIKSTSLQTTDANVIGPVTSESLTVNGSYPIQNSGFIASASGTAGGDVNTVFFDGGYWLSPGTYQQQNPATYPSTSYVDLNNTSQVVNGQWLQVQLPYAISLISYTYSVPDGWRGASTFSVLGSMDGTNWRLVDYQTGIIWTYFVSETRIFKTQSQEKYKYFRLVLTTIRGNDPNQPAVVTRWSLSASRGVIINSTTGSNMLTVNGSSSIGNGYVGTNAPTNGLIVQGNVGIGTSAPTQALDVTGTVKASSLMTGNYGPFRVLAGKDNPANFTGTVTFSTAFTSIPVVTATMNLAGGSTAVHGVHITAISTTSFSYIKTYINTGNATVNGQNNGEMNWIAIGL